MVEESELIPEIKDWKSSGGHEFTIEDWIACEGNIKLAIGFSFIFWPEFISFDDCVFGKTGFSEAGYTSWLKAPYIKNYAQVEVVLNHIHISDLFADVKQIGMTKQQIIYLGNILKDIYYVKLKSDFPSREFVVTFNDSEDVQELHDFELTFYQPINDERLLNQKI